jgi:amino acid transporter
LLPGWFGRISPRFATPANSILTVGCVGLALALSGTFVTLAVISTVSRLFAYLACIAAIPRLDVRDGNVRLVGSILLPLAAAALCLWAASQSRADEWRAFVAFLLAGSLLYLMARLGRRRA